MATNKRKDSAALFELIDKSTLKVPKTTGQLKIPSWWSSKSNPAAAGTSAGGITGGGHEGDEGIKVTSRPVENEPVPSALAARLAKRENGVAYAHSAPVTATPASAQDAQHRLFNPDDHAEGSPSIRPPTMVVNPVVVNATDNDSPAASVDSPAVVPPAVPVSSLVSSVPPVEAPSIAPPAVVPVEPAPSPPSAAPPPSVPRKLPTGVFAPQSVDRATIARHNWMNQQRSSFSRMPLGLLAGAVVVVLLLIVGVVYLAWGRTPVKSEGNQKIVGMGEGQRVPPPSGFKPSFTELNSSNTVMQPPVAQGNNGGIPGNTGGAGTDVEKARPEGKVWNPGQYAWNPELQYLLIAQTKSQVVAQRNAAFLAERGVNVAIEVSEGQWYRLIAVEGFKSLDTQSAKYRDFVVTTVGRQHPDYKKNKRDVWGDARFIFIVRPGTR